MLGFCDVFCGHVTFVGVFVASLETGLRVATGHLMLTHVSVKVSIQMLNLHKSLLLFN